ncbi:MAG: FliH/SctL family protein [Hydrogenophaga sp.]|uniref:FliH/SctL family protein n=1 Tax=Hydrogenophaga sp. TaxID=1904254 RepID=UPI002609F990|nr:FliH/SctL family protein [Hydrogenophaga sp.]MDM7942409.1 FliH/SctL family protein [Hydrogenophaga sp.]
MTNPSRLWQPRSFDPAPPPPPPVPQLDPAEVEEVFRLAREQGHAEGLAAGLAQGHAEGLERGLVDGRAQGHLDAFQQAQPRLTNLTTSLQNTLDDIRGLPDAIAEPVVDLALMIAQRLSGSQQFERAAFVQAVQEALMHLPMPGERLLLRLGPADEATWAELLNNYRLPFGHAIVIDADVPAGRAYVEVGGTRLDIGPAAREALVRSALGLPLLP